MKKRKERGRPRSSGFLELAVVPVAGTAGLPLLIASGKCGAIPILDFSLLGDKTLRDDATAREALSALADAEVPLGVRVDEATLPHLLSILRGQDSRPRFRIDLALLSGSCRDSGASLEALRPVAARVFREAVCEAEAVDADGRGFDGIVAKGNESGGRVGSETLFVLLQRLHGRVKLPVWAQGGIGPWSAAACVAAGASGILIDDQLALAEESDLQNPQRSLVAAMDGSETVVLNEISGHGFRVHRLCGASSITALRSLEGSQKSQKRFDVLLRDLILEPKDDPILPLGQAGAFAASLSRDCRGVKGILRAFRQGAVDGVRLARRQNTFAEGSPLAVAHNTRYPIVQGPMTRVSDTAAFARSVADAGALPFLALALMPGNEVEQLLSKTAAALEDRPWGVGILGFVPPELREEQVDRVLAFRPRYALLAGGRPDQARALEAEGIATYIHAPSVGLLDMFLRQGHRRFVLEGRECGGHVGPLASFVLWETALARLAEEARADKNGEAFHVLLAGGIRDGLSSAMAAAVGARAAEAGIRLGALMGSAYLFTTEAVETKALVRGFQEEALRCEETVLLDSEGGHAIRCAPTPFVMDFYAAKQGLVDEGLAPGEIRSRLEALNVGRLRTASKGRTRTSRPGSGNNGSKGRLKNVSEDLQHREGLYMLGQTAALCHKTTTIDELHRSVSSGSSDVLRKAEASLTAPEQSIEETKTARAATPVAIVGMACLYPGSPDVESFWRNILQGKDLVGEIPESRWPSSVFYDPDPSKKDRVISRWGSLLDPVPFDPLRYGIPPASLAAMDTRHLLMLEVVRHALADAGYDRRPFPKERTAVVVGTGGGVSELLLGYTTRIMLELYLTRTPEISRPMATEVLTALRRILPHPTEDSLAGTLENVTAGMVANRFDFGGPNFVVDAACASSLAAVEAAVKELRQGTSDLAVAGAVDTLEDIYTYLMFSKTGALSPTGRCRPFDAKADGIALGEGVAALLLKRLPDALRDGDRIYAVLRGAGASSDGREKSLTAPSSRGQRRALARAYEQAGISQVTVSLVEAHGTGTVLGDRTELATLQEFLRSAEASPRSVALGSVKSQVGHTKNAAGLAGLVKVASALHTGVLPPTLIEEPNPAAAEPDSPLYLNTRPRPWFARPDTPRRAAVSAFGFGGTNFHLVLEENQAHAAAPSERPAELLAFRAADRAGLSRQIDQLRDSLSKGFSGRLVDLAAALASEAERGQGPCRLAFVATSVEEAVEIMGDIGFKLKNDEAFTKEGVFFGDAPPEGGLAFLFPGQGSQFPGMLEELAVYFPKVRETFETADRVLFPKLGRPLTSAIFPPPVESSQAELDAQKSELSQTWLAQPALGAAEYAACRLLDALGLHPDAVAGQSYGEYVALCSAGVMTFNELLLLSEQRGRAVQETQGRGEVLMLAVRLSGEELEPRLAGVEGVRIAIRNSPEQCVVGGRIEAVDGFAKKLADDGVGFVRISMSAGFHIPEAQPAARRFAPALRRVDLRPPRLPVYSNRTASPYPSDADAIRRILREQLTRPIDFMGDVRSLYAAGVRTFVEVGPGRVLTGLVRRILRGQAYEALSVQPGRAPGSMRDFLALAASLWAEGRPLRLSRLFAGCELHPVEAFAPSAAKSVPATTWLVDGAGIRPLRQPPDARTASPPTPAKTVSTPLPANDARPAPPVETRERQAVPEIAGPLAHDVGDSDALAVFQANMDRFLEVQARADEGRRELMQRFLETQQNIVEAIVGGSNGKDRALAPYRAARVAEPPSRSAPPAGEVITQMPPAERVQELTTKDVEPVLPAEAGDNPRTTAAPLRKEQIEATLLELVSERTGYPADMLGLDQDLEADLGIDSIKRTEIFGMLRERLAGSDGREFDREAFFVRTGRLRTLREAATWIVEEGGNFGLGKAAPSGRDVVRPAEAAVAPADSSPRGGVLMSQAPPPTRTLPPAVADEPSVGGDGQGIAPESLQEDAIQTVLIQLVSDRTGYPTDMLGLDQDLEADLGIDSIKRTEIFGMLRERLAGSDGREFDREAFFVRTGRLRTLREAATWVVEEGGNFGLGKAATTPRAPFSRKEADSVEAATPVTRRVVHPVRSALRGQGEAAAPEGVVLLTEGDGETGRTLANALKMVGARVVSLRHGRGIRQESPDRWTVDFTAAEDLRSLRHEVTQKHGRVGTLAHLLPIDPGRSSEDIPGFEARSLFQLARTFSEDLQEGGLVVSMSALGGDFGRSSTNGFVTGASALPGLLRTLRREWPNANVKAIDIDRSDDIRSLLPNIAAEFFARTADVQVGLTSRGRQVLASKETPIDRNTEPRISLGPESVILALGGARGITSAICQELAARFGSRFVLAGRTPCPEEEAPSTVDLADEAEIKAVLIGRRRKHGEPLTPSVIQAEYRALLASREVRKTLQNMAERASGVEYVSLDVRNSGEVEALVNDIYARHGRLDGVLHGAGVIEDGLLTAKSTASFDRVFETKVLPALALARALKPKGLRFLAFFSSVAAHFGNEGQSDYAAANEALNALAARLDRQWPGRVVAMGWGPWAGVGMAPPELRDKFERAGFSYLGMEVGSNAFVDEILYGCKGESEVLIYSPAGEGPRLGSKSAELPVPGPRSQRARIHESR